MLTPRRAPGPRGRPITGSLGAFRRDPIRFLSGCARDYGDIARFTIGRQELFFVNHPDLIRDVLGNTPPQLRKGRGLERAKRLLGEGLLTSEDEFHRRQRRLLQPAFHRKRVGRAPAAHHASAAPWAAYDRRATRAVTRAEHSVLLTSWPDTCKASLPSRCNECTYRGQSFLRRRISG